jgi:hypothetical protein
MMRALRIATCVLCVAAFVFACSSTPVEPTGPEDIEVEPDTDTVAPTATADTPADEPSIPEAGESSTSDQEDPAAPEPESLRTIEGVSAFWCAEFRLEENAEIYVGKCFREEATCESERERGIAEKQFVTPCTFKTRAHCFIITDTERDRQFFRCFDDRIRCEFERRRYRGLYPKMVHSRCQLTASNRLPLNPQAFIRE